MNGTLDFPRMSSKKVLAVVIGFIESNPLLIERHNSRPSTQLIPGKIP